MLVTHGNATRARSAPVATQVGLTSTPLLPATLLPLPKNYHVLRSASIPPATTPLFEPRSNSNPSDGRSRGLAQPARAGERLAKASPALRSASDITKARPSELQRRHAPADLPSSITKPIFTPSGPLPSLPSLHNKTPISRLINMKLTYLLLAAPVVLAYTGEWLD